MGLGFALLPHVQILDGRIKKKEALAQFKLSLLISRIISDFNTHASLIHDFSSCLTVIIMQSSMNRFYEAVGHDT